MDIKILQLVDGAKDARGLTVIIDVFRAFSTACYAIDAGIEKIYPVGDIDLAFQLKKTNPDFLLVGERNEQKPPGFDFGNSPTDIINSKIFAKNMIHTTSSGTQGIANAVNADEIITGSFVNAGAICEYIKLHNPEKVSLVCMGYACQYPTTEDTLCAELIKNELEGKPNNFEHIKKTIHESDGSRFFEPDKQSWSPENDYHLCMDINRFNFVLKVKKEGSLNFLERINM